MALSVSGCLNFCLCSTAAIAYFSCDRGASEWSPNIWEAAVPFRADGWKISLTGPDGGGIESRTRTKNQTGTKGSRGCSIAVSAKVYKEYTHNTVVAFCFLTPGWLIDKMTKNDNANLLNDNRLGTAGAGQLKAQIVPAQPKTLQHLPKRPAVDLAFHNLTYRVKEGNRSSKYFHCLVPLSISSCTPRQHESGILNLPRLLSPHPRAFVSGPG